MQNNSATQILTPMRLDRILKELGFQNARLRRNHGHGYMMFEGTDQKSGKPLVNIIDHDSGVTNYLLKIKAALKDKGIHSFSDADLDYHVPYPCWLYVSVDAFKLK